MNLERIKFITAVILYGTIGLFLRYVSIPTEIVVMCRGIIGSAFILAYMKLTDRHINITAIKNNSLWLILSGICLGLNWGFLFAAYIRDISIIALGDYYSSISVFGLDAATALEEAISLGSTLMENQIMSERRDTVEHAWDYICSWVIRNKNKFLTPEMLGSNSEVYGKIVKGKYYVMASVLAEALKTGGFTSEDKCTKGFAERGYIMTVQENGKPCYQPSKSIQGSNVRVYILNLAINNKDSSSDSSDSPYSGDTEDTEGGAFLS